MRKHTKKGYASIDISSCFKYLYACFRNQLGIDQVLL